MSGFRFMRPVGTCLGTCLTQSSIWGKELLQRAVVGGMGRGRWFLWVEAPPFPEVDGISSGLVGGSPDLSPREDPPPRLHAVHLTLLFAAVEHWMN